jgi:hypothetical protein
LRTSAGFARIAGVCGEVRNDRSLELVSTAAAATHSPLTQKAVRVCAKTKERKQCKSKGKPDGVDKRALKKDQRRYNKTINRQRRGEGDMADEHDSSDLNEAKPTKSKCISCQRISGLQVAGFLPLEEH